MGPSTEYLDRSLDLFQTITHRIRLMDYLKDGVANRGFMKEVIHRHIGML